MIYREYVRDRMRWNESGNLENVFKDVHYLSELSDNDIQELLLKRLINYVDLFDTNAYSKLVLFADGNPRDALWITSQVVLGNMEVHKITGEIAEKTIRRIVKEYHQFGKN